MNFIKEIFKDVSVELIVIVIVALVTYVFNKVKNHYSNNGR